MQIEEKYLTGYNQISARVIEDSFFNGSRLTTFVLTFPRIVLAEFNTHRALSRNSASSRAIPFKKMLQKVRENPFVPIAFQKEHSGMQGQEYFEGEELVKITQAWLDSSEEAAYQAEHISKLGVTKQLCNRILEPFLYHTVIATGTEWQNFFALRAHEAAEIHIADLAHKMLEAYNSSSARILEIGDYHLPFSGFKEGLSLDEKIKVSVARCARVSYENFEGADDYEADFKLYDRLSQMGHWSPFEHVATPSLFGKYGGNFGPNWIQHRKTFKNENKKDPRVK